MFRLLYFLGKRSLQIDSFPISLALFGENFEMLCLPFNFILVRVSLKCDNMHQLLEY